MSSCVGVRLCLCVCFCVFKCLCVRVYVCVSVGVYVCVSKGVCMYVCMCKCGCVCVCVYVCVSLGAPFKNIFIRHFGSNVLQVVLLHLSILFFLNIQNIFQRAYLIYLLYIQIQIRSDNL